VHPAGTGISVVQDVLTQACWQQARQGHCDGAGGFLVIKKTGMMRALTGIRQTLTTGFSPKDCAP